MLQKNVENYQINTIIKIMSNEELEKIKDIEYLQKNLFKSLKIPLNLHGLKEDDCVGTKSLEIIKQNKDE